MLAPADVSEDLIAGASVLYAGSIALLREPFQSTARAAWSVPGPLRVFDPNVRPLVTPVLPERAPIPEPEEEPAPDDEEAILLEEAEAQAQADKDSANDTDASPRSPKSTGRRSMLHARFAEAVTV